MSVETAENVLLEFTQGETWTEEWDFTNDDGDLEDLSAFSGLMMWRDANDNLVLTVSTANGRLSLSATSKNIRISVPSSVTAAIAAGDYNHDIRLTSGSPATVDYLFRGIGRVHKAQSR